MVAYFFLRFFVDLACGIGSFDGLEYLNPLAGDSQEQNPRPTRKVGAQQAANPIDDES